MRTTTTRIRAFLPLFLLLLALGCDGSLVASETSDLAASDHERADIFYDLASLDVGDTFTATLLLDDGVRLALRTEGTDDGLSRTHLDTGDLDVTSITVEYLSDGVTTAPARTIDRSGFFFKGNGDGGDGSEDPPSSYHYEYRDGRYVIIQDYTASVAPSTSDQKQYLGTRGATFVMEDGTEAPVTHLRYTLHTEEKAAPPSTILFDSSVKFQLLESSIR